MTNIKDLLPIGSVVILKEGEQKLVIAGIMQTTTDDDGATCDYDYYGILYPQGHIGEDFQWLFNHEDIDEVVFRGFEDQERRIFIAKLARLYE